MKSELEATRRLADFDSTYEELAAQKRQMDCAVRMLKARVDDLKADLSVKQGIIK